MLRRVMMAGGGGYDAETITWESRIIALGGSVTTPEKDLADALINAIQAASYGSKIQYLLPFIGASIAAHRVPLRDTLNVGAATNGGASPFTDSDCDTSTGIVNSTEKAAFLDTLINPSQLGINNNGGVGWWERNWGAGIGVSPIGTYGITTVSGDERFLLDLRSSMERFRWGGVTNSQAGPGTTAGNGHYYGQRSSSTLRRIYKNGTSLGTDGTALDSAEKATDQTMYAAAVHSVGDSLETWKGRGAVAYLTDGTLSDADVAAFHTLLDTYLITPTGR